MRSRKEAAVYGEGIASVTADPPYPRVVMAFIGGIERSFAWARPNFRVPERSTVTHRSSPPKTRHQFLALLAILRYISNV
jgi:hypothetical protein